MRKTIAAACAALTLAVPGSAAAADQQLTGTVRDFRGWDLSANGALGLPRGHQDFENANGAESGIVGALGAPLGSDGLPVYAKEGVASATTHGRAPFDQWFRDTPNVNLASPLTLPLTEIAPGRHQYDSAAYFPADGQGWTARGTQYEQVRNGHNFSFTTELHGDLTYDPGNATIALYGDDDLWLYVDGKLRLDLGGVHNPAAGTLDLSTLGLTPGRVYTLDLFQAERHTTGSNLRITTPTLGFAAGTASVTNTPAFVGRGLGCAATGWPAGVDLTAQWLRDGAPIPGATGFSYLVTAADAGRGIACRVTGTRRTSASADAVPALVPVPPAPAATTPVPPVVTTPPIATLPPATPARPATPSCSRARSATVKLSGPKGTKLRSASARVGGKALRFTVKGRTATAKLDLSKRPAGTTKVTIRGVTTKGRKVSRTLTFRVCAR